MAKNLGVYHFGILLCLIGSAAFGIWQNSALAGLWMLVVLFILTGISIGIEDLNG